MLTSITSAMPIFSPVFTLCYTFFKFYESYLFFFSPFFIYIFFSPFMFVFLIFFLFCLSLNLFYLIFASFSPCPRSLPLPFLSLSLSLSLPLSLSHFILFENIKLINYGTVCFCIFRLPPILSVYFLCLHPRSEISVLFHYFTTRPKSTAKKIDANCKTKKKLLHSIIKKKKNTHTHLKDSYKRSKRSSVCL